MMFKMHTLFPAVVVWSWKGHHGDVSGGAAWRFFHSGTPPTLGSSELDQHHEYNVYPLVN